MTGGKQVEEELEAALALLQATLESTADAILVTDGNGRIVNVNRSFAALWRIPPSVRLTDPEQGLAFVLAQLRDPDAFMTKVRELHEHPEVESEDLLELKDGRNIQRYSRPQKVGGHCVGRVWSFRDITQQRQLQATLFAADRLASMGSLAAGVAHEINNPLSYVIANLVLLAEMLPSLLPKDGDALREASEMLNDCRQGTERVRRIVRDLKVFSRSDDETDGPADVRRAMESSISMAFNEIRHRARLVKDYGVAPPVKASEGRLCQVFLNLLVNAAQSIPEGAVDQNEIRVLTTTDTASGRVVVELRDTGVGIPPEDLARIFDPFFTTKPVGVGTGLGLAVCHSIVTALGGDMTVESEVGKGSVFRVLFPVASEAVEPSKKPSEQPVGLQRGRVLLVDDEPMIAAVTRRVLGGEHDVRTVNSGREALKLLMSGEAVDLILCDLMMADVTGMDLHAELSRSAPEMADRIVFITGGAFTPKAREFLNRVPNARIEKPFEPANLRAFVRRFLR